jgi:hypothetical protein
MASVNESTSGFDTQNMPIIDIRKWRAIIETDMISGNYKPVLGMGPGGVGKSESVRDMCEDMGIGYVEMRLANYTPLDIMGLPSEKNGRTVFNPNDKLPYTKAMGGDQPEVGILMLDEISSCEHDVQVVALQLLDSSRSVGQYKLPDKWKVVACGNGPDDGGVYRGLPSNLINRCAAYRIEPVFQIWKEYLMSKSNKHGKSSAHPVVTAFLEAHPNFLCSLNPNTVDRPFSSPRSWTRLAEQLNDAWDAKEAWEAGRKERIAEARRSGDEDRIRRAEDEKYVIDRLFASMDQAEGKLNTQYVTTIASAVIGEDVGVKFSVFYKFEAELKTFAIDDIEKWKVKPSLEGLKREAIMILIEQLTVALADHWKLGKFGQEDFYDRKRYEKVKQDPNKVAHMAAMFEIIGWGSTAIVNGSENAKDVGSTFLANMQALGQGFSQMLILSYTWDDYPKHSDVYSDFCGKFYNT